jgi:hypothetical protein
VPSTTRRTRAIPPLSERDEARFWAKVALPNEQGCMLWTAHINAPGYGQFRHAEQAFYVHRISYTLAYGEIPIGMEVDHVRSRGCVNRHCVAPAHLELVDRDENMRRVRRTHCKKGHAFDKKNTYIRKDTGVRMCRACSRARRLAAVAAGRY